MILSLIINIFAIIGFFTIALILLGILTYYKRVEEDAKDMGFMIDERKREDKN